METFFGKGERWGNSWGRDTEKQYYLLSSEWKDTKKLSDIRKIMVIILHLLHQLQYWPGSAISYKDSTYILQLEFSFIPWLFHAWTIAIMFVPSYFFFFLTTHYKAIQSCCACFVSHWSILAVHILFSSLLFSYMCSVTYEIKIGTSIYHCNHSRTSKTADSNFLSILQSICWACITAATQIIHLCFACLKYMHFTCSYV